jgi:hypothetical protein
MAERNTYYVPPPMFAVAVARRKWESLQGDGYRMQRIQFARSVNGHEQRGSIDPWGKVLWEPVGVPGRDADTNRDQPPMPDGADR